MLNPSAIASVFASVDPPVWVVTARAGQRCGGLIATTVTSLSIVPEMPRILVALARQHNTWELVEASGSFALHLIGEEQVAWVPRFGLASARQVDKLAGLATRTAATGSPILEDALGWLDCRVEARLETGDRTIYVAEVVDGGLPRQDTPLTVRRMLTLISPQERQALKDALARDAAIDAAAIQAWRQEQAGTYNKGNIG